MNGVIFGEIERLTPAESLSLSGDLKFWQRKPLAFAGNYNFTQDLVQLNETDVAFGSTLYIPYEIQQSTLQNNFTFQLDRFEFIRSFKKFWVFKRSLLFWGLFEVIRMSNNFLISKIKT